MPRKFIVHSNSSQPAIRKVIRRVESRPADQIVPQVRRLSQELTQTRDNLDFTIGELDEEKKTNKNLTLKLEQLQNYLKQLVVQRELEKTEQQMELFDHMKDKQNFVERFQEYAKQTTEQFDELNRIKEQYEEDREKERNLLEKYRKQLDRMEEEMMELQKINEKKDKMILNLQDKISNQNKILGGFQESRKSEVVKSRKPKKTKTTQGSVPNYMKPTKAQKKKPSREKDGGKERRKSRVKSRTVVKLSSKKK